MEIILPIILVVLFVLLFNTIVKNYTKASKNQNDIPLDRTDTNIDFSDTELFADAKCEKCAIRKCCSRCYGMNFIYSGSVSSAPPIFCSASQIEFFATCSLLYQRLRRNQPIAHRHETEAVLNYVKKVIQTK